jgi:hypothetical protein
MKSVKELKQRSARKEYPVVNVNALVIMQLLECTSLVSSATLVRWTTGHLLVVQARSSRSLVHRYEPVRKILLHCIRLPLYQYDMYELFLERSTEDRNSQEWHESRSSRFQFCPVCFQSCIVIH